MNTRDPDASLSSAASDTPRAPRRRRGRWLGLLVSVALVAILVYVGRGYFGELERLGEVPPWLVIAMVAVFLLTRLLTSEVMRLALLELGHRIGHVEAMLLGFLRAYANLIIPRSGFGAAGVYLKMRHGVTLANYGSLVLPLTVLQLIVIGGTGLGTQAWLLVADQNRPSPLVATAFAVVVAAGVLGVVVPLVVPQRWSGRMGRFLAGLSASWHTLRSSRGLAWRVLLLQAATILLRAGRLQLAFWAVGATPDPLGVLVASLLADIMFVLSLTPGALGFREAAIVYGIRLAGVGEPVSLAAAILDRVLTTVVIIVMAQIGLWRLIRPMRERGAGSP